LVIEVTVVAITAGFGAPRATPVITVLGYRVVNYRFPLLPGALAYLRLRLSLNMADKAKPRDRRWMIRSWELYAYWRQMLAKGNGLVSTDIDWPLPGVRDGTAPDPKRKEYPSCSSQHPPR